MLKCKGRREMAALFVALLLASSFFLAACSQVVPGLDELYPDGEQPTGIAPPAESFQPLAPATQAEQTLQRLLATEKPDRDLFDLGRRYKGIAQNVDRIVNAAQPDYAVGTVQTFWVADDANSTYYQIRAELRGKSENLYMYVEEGLDIPQSGIDKTIQVFEETIYPTVRQVLRGRVESGRRQRSKDHGAQRPHSGCGWLLFFSRRVSERC